jgi:hypothetical protein
MLHVPSTNIDHATLNVCVALQNGPTLHALAISIEDVG